MPDFGPIEISGPIEVQSVCTGPGGTVYGQVFTVEADCEPECVITSQPVSVAGPAGTNVSLGGAGTGAVQWQTAAAVTGPWVNATPPTQVVAGAGLSYWRLVCAADPTITSNIVAIEESDAVYTAQVLVACDTGGTPILQPGVQVDLFADTDQDGQQDTYLESVNTNNNGLAVFTGLEPGCYVMVAIAPASTSWPNDADEFRQIPFCITNADARPADQLLDCGLNAPFPISGQLNCSDGSVLADLQVDLYEDTNEDGIKDGYLFTVQTDSSGQFTHTVPNQPGSYVLVFIAPPGGVFEDNGTGFLEVPVSVTNAGLTMPAIIVDCDPQATPVWALTANVDCAQDGQPYTASAIQVDLYLDPGDGNLGAFITNTTTTGGQAVIDVPQTAENYVLVFIAPAGQTWDSSGTQFLQVPVQVTTGPVTAPTASLNCI